MNKVLVVIFLVMIIVSNNVFSQDNPREKILGNVLSIEEITWSFKKEGDSYLPNMKLSSKNEYIYNDNGQIIEIKAYFSEIFLLYRQTIEYDASGNKKSVVNYNSSGEVVDTIKYLYGEKGQLIEENKYDSTGKLIEKSKYQIDDKYRIIVIIKYDSNGKMMNKIELKYSEGDNIIEELVYDSQGRFIYKTEYYYNEKNIQIKKILSHITGKKQIEEYIIDSNGLVEKVCFTSETGEALLMHNPSGDAYNIAITKYQIDQNGNWNEKDEYAEQERFGEKVYEPIYHTSRIITYK